MNASETPEQQTDLDLMRYLDQLLNQLNEHEKKIGAHLDAVSKAADEVGNSADGAIDQVTSSRERLEALQRQVEARIEQLDALHKISARIEAQGEQQEKVAAAFESSLDELKAAHEEFQSFTETLGGNEALAELRGVYQEIRIAEEAARKALKQAEKGIDEGTQKHLALLKTRLQELSEEAEVSVGAAADRAGGEVKTQLQQTAVEMQKQGRRALDQWIETRRRHLKEQAASAFDVSLSDAEETLKQKVSTLVDEAEATFERKTARARFQLDEASERNRAQIDEHRKILVSELQREIEEWQSERLDVLDKQAAALSEQVEKDAAAKLSASVDLIVQPARQELEEWVAERKQVVEQETGHVLERQLAEAQAEVQSVIDAASAEKLDEFDREIERVRSSIDAHLAEWEDVRGEQVDAIDRRLGAVEAMQKDAGGTNKKQWLLSGIAASLSLVALALVVWLSTSPRPSRSAAAIRTDSSVTMPVRSTSTAFELTADSVTADAIAAVTTGLTARPQPGNYSWILASYRSAETAREARADLITEAVGSRIVVGTSGGRPVYRIAAGRFAALSDALDARNRLPDSAPANAWIARVQFAGR